MKELTLICKHRNMVSQKFLCSNLPMRLDACKVHSDALFRIVNAIE